MERKERKEGTYSGLEITRSQPSRRREFQRRKQLVGETLELLKDLPFVEE